MIQRADRLADILRHVAGLGAVTVVPIWPKAGEAAARVIVRVRLGRRTPLRLLSGLVLHDEDGRYTDAAAAILSGSGLDLDAVSRAGSATGHRLAG